MLHFWFHFRLFFPISSHRVIVCSSLKFLLVPHSLGIYILDSNGTYTPDKSSHSFCWSYYYRLS